MRPSEAKVYSTAGRTYWEMAKESVEETGFDYEDLDVGEDRAARYEVASKSGRWICRQ